ncbi:zf-HC2 domain-containing protein, partial [bacterium]|nr:zf-HC2 domain-containing protein [candidate division CSSED10-310 bacterium]
MNCDTTRRLCDAYLDGSLDDVRRCEMTAHLEKCPDCRRYVGEYRAVMEHLAALPRFSSRPGFEERLLRRWRWESQPRRQSPFVRLAPLHQLAGALLVLVVAIAVWQLPVMRRAARHGEVPLVAPSTTSELETEQQAASGVVASGAASGAVPEEVAGTIAMSKEKREKKGAGSRDHGTAASSRAERIKD